MNPLLKSILLILLISCSGVFGNRTENANLTVEINNKSGNTIIGRFNPPEGFQRTAAESNSFTYYLRRLPLKADGSRVLYYDVRRKSNSWVAEAGSLKRFP
jgi:hypothetical protein